MKAPFHAVASLDKVGEGGSLSQKDVKAIAKRHGLECQVSSDWSPYVGQFGVALRTRDQRKIGKFLRAVGL